MSKEYQFRDATAPLTLHVIKEDRIGATPGSVANCVLTRCARREHGFYDIVVFRTRAYVRRSERSIPLRYQVTQAAKDVLVAFDAAGRCHDITVTFRPPRPAISLKRLRSSNHKKRRQASYRRMRELDRKAAGAGKAASRERIRRAYTKPDPLTLLGVRNGSGGRPPGARGARLGR